MAVSDYIKYNDLIRIIYRKGTGDDPFVSKADTKQIINGYIILDEIPDKFNHVSIEGYVEIYSGTPSSNEFKVNYQNGVVTFNSSEEGKIVTASYFGRGVLLYPAERLYAHNENPDVTQTLQNIIDTYENLSGQDIYDKFDPVIGHKHTGEAGDAPTIPDFAEHKIDTMPHEFQDSDTGKTYKYGFGQEDGFVKFIYEEVI